MNLIGKLASLARSLLHRVELVADDPSPEPTTPPPCAACSPLSHRGVFVMDAMGEVRVPEPGEMIQLAEFVDGKHGWARVTYVTQYSDSPAWRVIDYERPYSHAL